MVNGIKMSVAWDTMGDEFTIFFDGHPEEMEGALDHGIVQSYISLGQSDMKQLKGYLIMPAQEPDLKGKRHFQCF